MKNLKKDFSKLLAVLIISLIMITGIGGVIYVFYNLGLIKLSILIGSFIFLKVGIVMLRSINLKF
tara:strand:- start:1158 stop:1352 length:195 start_codon:yes stop_codon:yes gene_type:complete